jgi:hypothetical protein
MSTSEVSVSEPQIRRQKPVYTYERTVFNTIGLQEVSKRMGQVGLEPTTNGL